MSTSIPESKETLFAYLTIHDFFDTYLVQDALQFLLSILHAAQCKNTWKWSSPFSLLYYMDNLKKLCAAAYTIHVTIAQRNGAIIGHPPADGNPSISILQTCTGNKRGDNLWSCFPRSLTLKQFYDPYKAIKKCCSYLPQTSWEEAFSNMQEYALSQATINHVYPGHNILKLQLRLSQLIEACHLLEVRTNNSNKNPANNPKKEK